MSDRQRLDIPNASSLDLEDDSRSSFTEGSGRDEDDDHSSTEEGDNGEDTELHRVSAYGPKMTVHSRAPWETGEEDDDDPDELDGASRRGFKFSKGDGGKLKPRQLNGRNVVDARPSIDSTRSQATKSKHSFDTVSSNISAGSALL